MEIKTKFCLGQEVYIVLLPWRVPLVEIGNIDKIILSLDEDGNRQIDYEIYGYLFPEGFIYLTSEEAQQNFENRITKNDKENKKNEN